LKEELHDESWWGILLENFRLEKREGNMITAVT
jgi:hypothetical protein